MSSIRMDTVDGTTETLKFDASDCSKDAFLITVMYVVFAVSSVCMTRRTCTLLPCRSRSIACACGSCTSKTWVRSANSRSLDETRRRLKGSASMAALDSVDETSLRLRLELSSSSSSSSITTTGR